MYKYKHAGLNNGRLSGFGTHLKDHKTDEQSACAQSCPLTIPCTYNSISRPTRRQTLTRVKDTVT